MSDAHVSLGLQRRKSNDDLPTLSHDLNAEMLLHLSHSYRAQACNGFVSLVESKRTTIAAYSRH